MAQLDDRVCDACGARNRVPLRHLAHRGTCGRCRATLPPEARPLDVDEARFDAIVRESPVPVLVDFWAAWCGPCRMAAPEVEKAARALAGRALVLKVDTERSPGLAARFQVRGIPYFAVIDGGRQKAGRAGLMPANELVQLTTASA